MIDGVDTTDLRFGTSGKPLANDFVQEVQVKSSGYNAEYRAAIGGVISAVTKSGGNQYRERGHLLPQDMLGAVRPSAPGSERHDESRIRRQPVDDFTESRSSISVDRSSAIVCGSTLATTQLDERRARSGSCRTSRRARSPKPIDQNFNFNVTGQVRPDLRARFSTITRRSKGSVGSTGDQHRRHE